MQFGDIWLDDVFGFLPGKYEQKDPECAAYSKHGRKVGNNWAKSFTEEMHKTRIETVENIES